MPSFSCAGPVRISCDRAVLHGLDARAARQRRVERRHAPVKAAAGRLVGARQRRADHDRVGAARDRLGDVAAVAHPAVGDDLAVLAGLEHVLRAGARDVGDRRRLRHADAEHAARRAGGAGADADEHAGGAGAHEVQRRVVARAAADDDGQRHLADELLEVQRRARLVAGDVLGRDDRALDDEDVQARLERGLVVRAHPLRGQRSGDDDALLLDLRDPLGDELGDDRRVVDLLHLARGGLGGQQRDALEHGLGVLVAREDALEVEHGEAAELADDARRPRRDDAVHRRGQQRQLEAVVAELPRDVHVVGIACAPGRHDRDVVEAVCAAGFFPASDLNLHLRILGVVADKTTPSRRGRGRRIPHFAGGDSSRFELSNGSDRDPVAACPAAAAARPSPSPGEGRAGQLSRSCRTGWCTTCHRGSRSSARTCPLRPP